MCMLQDALLSFEKMLNETKGDEVIEYSRHAQINRGITCVKRHFFQEVFLISYIETNDLRNE